MELIDIAERPGDEVASTLRRYLERVAVRSGASVKAAREDLQSTKAAANIPDAWASLLKEPDGLIVECLAERVEENTGVAPAKQDIRNYLARLQVPRIVQDSKSVSASVQEAGQPAAAPLTALQAFDIAAQSDFHKSSNPSTTDRYKRYWLEFAEWCDSNGHSWLPASPEHVVGWLETNWPRRKAQSLTHDLRAIGLVHEAHGRRDPASSGSPPRECYARLKRKEDASSKR